MSIPRTQRLQIESLESRQLLDAEGLVAVVDAVDVAPIDVDPRPIELASVHGRKWEDLNGNGSHDAGEPGLPGVTIYADLNRNGVLDEREPRTVSMRDIPQTDFDEAGLYHLTGLRPGEYLIREVVPDGFEQTFPPVHVPMLDDAADVLRNGFASVEPERLVMRLAAGELRVERAGVTIHPLCFRPIQVDVVASDPAIRFENLSGPKLNGCGGDTSNFRVAFAGDGQTHRFNLQFIDTLSQDAFAEIPVLIMAPHSGGAHLVVLRSGQSVDGLDFGNQRIPPATGAIHGMKWLDANRNGQREPREPGVPGVTIYLDINRNYRLDRDEPRTLTMRDNPKTIVDETGLYGFEDLEPGKYAVREVVPDGWVQTYPGWSRIDPPPSVDVLPYGASHIVHVRPGQTVEDVDFGNRPRPIVGDFDHDGDVDADDIDLLGVAIREFSSDPQFDLTGDGRVDLRDLYVMVKDVLDTDFGDSNLDGVFDSADLIQALAAGEYEDDIDGNSGWAEGDWNADGDFDSGDLIVAFSDGGYVRGARALVAAAVDVAVKRTGAPRG